MIVKKIKIERASNGLIMSIIGTLENDIDNLPYTEKVVFGGEDSVVRPDGLADAYQQMFAEIKEALGDYDLCVRVRSYHFEPDQEKPKDEEM